MKLTSYTDYTLRTLMYLAARAPAQATIAEIARTYGISEAHLTKIAHQLGLAGDIETLRGKGGGLRLKRRPEEINLGAVVRRTEPDLALMPCFAGAGICRLEPSCALQHALQAALVAFLGVLDSYTLADLITPRQTLAALLGVEPPLPARVLSQ